jgi:acyl carrier protein
MNKQIAVRKYIEGLARKAGKPATFADHESLFVSGFLDSISAINLVTFLETEFGLKTGDLFSIIKLDTVDAIMAALE